MNPDKIFNIDYNKLVRLLLPSVLRKNKITALMMAFVSPVVYLYQIFLRNRDANLYRLKITPQVVYLECLLNDRYDRDLRRIYIGDPFSHDPVFFYLEEENKRVNFFTEAEDKPVNFFTENEAGLITTDFIVNVPYAIGNFNANEMKALLNAYKLAGKQYLIQRV